MSWLRDGRSRTNLTRHKTYETERVQKRLNSVIPTVQSKVEQALAVDSAEVIIYKRAKIGMPCSCQMVSNDFTDEVDGVDKTLSKGGFGEAGTTLAPSNQTMFGGMSNTQGTDVIDASTSMILEMGDLTSSYGSDDEDEYIQDPYSVNPLTGGNVNCGICYRQGVQPGFQPHGYIYNVMTHYHVHSISGYTLDQSATPHVFEQVQSKGRVVFDTLVPLYFKNATYSIRLNEIILDARYKPEVLMIENGEEVYVDLTMDLLDSLRGETIKVVVRGVEAFTHATLIFDQGIETIDGNISEEQNVLNYDQELTVGNITVVLPSKVGMLNPEDILIVPKRNYVLKVNEATKKRTARGDMWEWNVTTRAVQRKEYIYRIHKGYKVF